MKIRRIIAVIAAASIFTGLFFTGPVFGAQELLTEDRKVDDTASGEIAGDELIPGEAYITQDITSGPSEEGGTYTESSDFCDAINKVLVSRNIMGVLYLCDEYPLRREASGDSEAAAILRCGTTLYLKEAVFADGEYWFLVSAFTGAEESYGYVPLNRFICVDEEYLAWEKEIEESGYGSLAGPDRAGGGSTLTERAMKSVYSFPDSYRDKLFNVLYAHPNWVFVPQKVGTSLDEALNAQLETKERNLIYKTANEKYRNGRYDSSWYYVSKEGLAYYMNPANFVGSEKNMFMFEQLTYNGSYHTQAGVQSVLSTTFMKGNIPGEGMTYAEAFYKIGSSLKVSPYHLAVRVYQEQGQGTSPLISGSYSGYEGYYNYFNVQANGSTNTQIFTNGLSYAKKQGWDTRYKSLLGGATFDSKNYILAGQDTPYLEKYNVVKKAYWHQYMQNVAAPVSESSKMYEMYKASGALNNPFVFKIPVYDGDKISPDPRTKPTLRIVKDHPSNLYYTMGTDEVCAEYTVSASEEIKSLSLTKESVDEMVRSGKPYYDILSYDEDTGKLILTPVGLDPSNYNKINKKVIFDIEFAEYGYVTYILNVSTTNTAPVIKPAQTTVYGGIDRGEITLTHSGLPEDTEVLCDDENVNMSLDGDKSSISFTVREGFKGGSRKLIFTSSDWRAPVRKTVRVKYVKDPAAAYKLSASGKIKLSDPEKTCIVYTPKMTSFPSVTIDNFSLEGDDSNLFEMTFLDKGDRLPNGKKVGAASGVFVLGASDPEKLIYGEKYTLDIVSELSNGLRIVKTVTVKPVR
ncbi:MAG TPA: hypothetical protein DIS78_08005 [Lachnospiraceae bacterium]|nr:hypothetical protein [Lachnospiraceae bacterium]